ncbi:C39 family peptidase [Micromonospora carbonacea]|uniref:C39 family peptidase n=1 Tax=Micromonospora carbonacea TaxID=47853 RepID=A0A7H8XSR1_9ACTN|nr:C39 family peptidase [Micromonospora carbonacea]MBB5824968.1 hypothetical protein [Micromonospora carbonacea]QLD26912.1 C39 family peptidase [Micromonospora carbonacea]
MTQYQALSGYVGQLQQKTNWCWNATTASVAHHYNKMTDWTQCGLATAVLNDKYSEWFRQNPGQPKFDCCGPNGGPWNCNEGWWPDEGPLQKVGHKAAGPRLGVLSKQEITQEVANNRPILLNIAWAGGGGHIVNIFGYSQLEDGTVTDVWVHDPWDGTYIIPYEELRDKYKTNGTWTASMKSQP